LGLTQNILLSESAGDGGAGLFLHPQNYFGALLSGYKLNKFSWLSAPGNSSWESIC
jgi:hypothetical protein